MNSTTIWREYSSSLLVFSSLPRRVFQTLVPSSVRMAILFSHFGTIPPWLQRQGALALWTPELVVRSTHSLEVLQHKAFALILLAIGIIEVQRARGAIKAGWSRWIFPVLACCGSVTLLFHEHSGEMIGAGHMGAMAQIQTQHRSFAAAGFGIGIFKGFSELPTRWQEMYARLWPSLVIVLGVLLLGLQ